MSLEPFGNTPLICQVVHFASEINNLTGLQVCYRRVLSFFSRKIDIKKPNRRGPSWV